MGPVLNQIIAIAGDAASYITRLRLGTCLSAAAAVLPFLIGGGEAAALTEATDTTTAAATATAAALTDTGSISDETIFARSGTKDMSPPRPMPSWRAFHAITSRGSVPWSTLTGLPKPKRAEFDDPIAPATDPGDHILHQMGNAAFLMGAM
jgi:hypothetical protein